MESKKHAENFITRNMSNFRGFRKRMCYLKYRLEFAKQNIYCGYLKEPSQADRSSEHMRHTLELMIKNKKVSEYDQEIPQSQTAD